MSRSYKYPVWKDQSSRSQIKSKRLANKRIRNHLKLLSFGFKGIKYFHKLFNTWDICDWKWYPRTKEDKLKAKRK